MLDTLPAEYDARVKAMEVDEKPAEDYADIGGLDKQIQELVEAVVLPIQHKVTVLDWIGTGLDWIGVDWIGLDWTGLDRGLVLAGRGREGGGGRSECRGGSCCRSGTR